MDRLLFFASVLAWATAGLALPAAVDAAECIRGANGCQFQESLNSASKPSTSLEGQLAGGTLGHLPLQQQDDPPRSQSNVQDGNTVHVKNHASLRRRTNEPPRKLSQAEWNDKRSRALTQLLEALERDDALLGRMAKVLGVPVSPFPLSPTSIDVLDLISFAQKRARMHEMSFNHAEINNALRQAKYTGDLLPEEHELESRPQRDRRRPSTEDMSQEFRQESARVARLVLSDPEFLRKFRESLGLQVSKAVKRLG